jgi:hypothetical protein
MTIAFAIAIPTCVVFALGVYLGRRNHGYTQGRTDGYSRGYDQGKFDEYMDRITGYDAREAKP